MRISIQLTEFLYDIFMLLQ